MRRIDIHLRGRVATAWWQGLERLGVQRPRERWSKAPAVAQRTGPLLVVMVLALAIGWAWRQPDPVFLIILAIALTIRAIPPGLRRYVLPPAALAAAIAYPFYLGKLFTMPILGSFPDVHTGVVMAVFVMMAIGLNMVVGYAGLLDLGYVAFYAIGAYTAGWFASPQFAGVTATGGPKRSFHVGAIGVGQGVGGIHVSIWLLLLVAACLTAFAGVLIGLPTLRLRGDYLAIVTLGFGEILPQIARNGDNLFGTGFNLTGGPQGITPIDPPGFGHWLSVHLGLPADFITETGQWVNTNNLFFWAAIGLVVITVFCSIRLRDSRLGRAWIAIREDEVAAAAMGIPLMRTKTWAYAAGAFFGGMAGCFYGAFNTGVFADNFFFNISVLILCMVILGGMGNVWGVLVGASLLAWLNYWGLGNIGGWMRDHHFVSSSFDITKYAFGIYGLMLLVVMLFRPQGLIPSERRKRELETGVADEPLYDTAHAGT